MIIFINEIELVSVLDVQHATIRKPLNGFSLNLVLVSFNP